MDLVMHALLECFIMVYRMAVTTGKYQAIGVSPRCMRLMCNEGKEIYIIHRCFHSFVFGKNL